MSEPAKPTEPASFTAERLGRARTRANAPLFFALTAAVTLFVACVAFALATALSWVLAHLSPDVVVVPQAAPEAAFSSASVTSATGEPATKAITVTTTAAKQVYSSTYQQSAIRCANISTTPIYVVTGSTGTTAQGSGPYCSDTAACPLSGNAWNVRELWARTASGSTSWRCEFLDGDGSFSTAGVTPPAASFSGVDTVAPITGDGTALDPLGCTLATGALGGCLSAAAQTIGGPKRFDSITVGGAASASPYLVETHGVNNGAGLFTTSDTAGDRPVLYFLRDLTTPVAPQTGTRIGEVGFAAFDSSAYATAAMMTVDTSQAWGGGAHAVTWDFSSTKANELIGRYSRMRFEHDKTVINNDGADIDTLIKTDTTADAVVIDAGAGAGVGTLTVKIPTTLTQALTATSAAFSAGITATTAAFSSTLSAAASTLSSVITALVTFAGDLTISATGAGGDVILQSGSDQTKFADNTGAVRARIDVDPSGGRGLFRSDSSNGSAHVGASGWIGTTSNAGATTIVGGVSESQSVSSVGTSIFGCYGGGLCRFALAQSVTCAAGVATVDIQASTVVVDPAGAACAVTIAKTTAAGLTGARATFVIAATAGAGVVTFPNNADHAGPVLCTTTGLTEDGTYSVLFADKATDIWVGQACSDN